jgi:phosphatidylglycerophosphate synthase
VSKSSEGVLKAQYGWTVSFLLPFTPYFARLAVEYRVSANQVSWSSLVVFMVGLFFYFFYNDFLLFRILAVFLFCVGTFLDVLDGAVARLSKTRSKYGANLDSGIDLFRYNIFFLSVFALFSLSVLDFFVLFLYVVLLNYSFIVLFVDRYNDIEHKTTNSDFGGMLPRWYRDFCTRYRLLYNPFNLEDQLLFLFFIVGVLFQVEVFMLYFALFFRLINVFLVIKNKLLGRF